MNRVYQKWQYPYTATGKTLVLGRRHTKETGNRNFEEFLLSWVGHEEMDCAAHKAETARQLVAHKVTARQLAAYSLNCKETWGT